MLAPAALASGAPVRFPFRGSPSSYGLGWFLAEMCGEPVATHGGTIAGFSANLSWARRRRIAIVALANGKALPDRTGVVDRPAAAALRTALGCAS